MGQIVTFDKTHAVFTGNGAFHIDRSLNHTVDDVLSYSALFFVEKKNGWKLLLVKLDKIEDQLTVKIAIANMSNHRCK